MVLIANTGIGNSCVVIRWCILGKLIYMLGKKSIIVSCIFCFCGGDCSINNGDDNNRCVDSNIYIMMTITLMIMVVVVVVGVVVFPKVYILFDTLQFQK